VYVFRCVRWWLQYSWCWRLTTFEPIEFNSMHRLYKTRGSVGFPRAFVLVLPCWLRTWYDNSAGLQMVPKSIGWGRKQHLKLNRETSCNTSRSGDWSKTPIVGVLEFFLMGIFWRQNLLKVFRMHGTELINKGCIWRTRDGSKNRRWKSGLIHGCRGHGLVKFVLAVRRVWWRRYLNLLVLLMGSGMSC
jgi:hypothetical protein